MNAPTRVPAAIGLIGALVLSGCGTQQGPGLAIGEKAPEFQLQDQNGVTRTLAEALQDGTTALVFYRSADW